MGQQPSKELRQHVSASTGDQGVVCLRIPADGSFPELVRLPTVCNYDGNHDSYLFHLPDFRLYWGSEERWRFRTFGTMEVHKQDVANLDGLYYMYKSFAMDNAPYNKHLRTYTRGDVFIVKLVSDYGNGEGQAVFADVAPELLGSKLLASMLQAMSIPGTLFWTINYDDSSSFGYKGSGSSTSVSTANGEVQVISSSSNFVVLENKNDRKDLIKPLRSHPSQIYPPLISLSS
ncbi:hypothetical protein BDQ17DRAFT_1434207 [Cyathus striatus]|nr:hypothetical protein BDQ17DRAFT_1434207 [Cyathus striatus]